MPLQLRMFSFQNQRSLLRNVPQIRGLAYRPVLRFRRQNEKQGSNSAGGGGAGGALASKGILSR